MSFYPGHLPAPELLRTAQFILEPLRPSHNSLDHEAVMASREQLRLWGGHDWPADHFSLSANHEDLALHWREHQGHIAFTYTVLTPNRRLCLGCVYIRPLAELQAANPSALPQLAPDVALVRFWVRTDHLSGPFEANLLDELRHWFAAEWPFSRLLFETRGDNERQVALFVAAGMSLTCRLHMPDRGGEHLFFDNQPLMGT